MKNLNLKGKSIFWQIFAHVLIINSLRFDSFLIKQLNMFSNFVSPVTVS